MKTLDKIKKNWDFSKSIEQNVITFSNEQEQARRKGERLRKRLFPLFVILGVAISIFTQNPLIALVLFMCAISYSSEYVFNSADTYNISVSTLDSTHFVVGYQDTGNSNYGTCIIGTISGSTISYGSEYVFNSADTYNISVSTLDSTHFVVVYRDDDNSYYGTAIIGTISGSTISYGSEYVFNQANTYDISVSALDSTHFVVGYCDSGNSNYGTARIGTIFGSTISYGSEYVFNQARTSLISVSALDSTHFVVGYRDNGNSYYGTAIIGTISGSTISYGSEYVFNSATTYEISVSALDSTHFVVVYRDNGNSNYGTAIIGTIFGSTISYGSEYVFNSAYTNFISVSALDSTHFVVVYRDDDNSYYGTAIIGTISGSTISYGSEYVFNSAYTNYISVSALDSTHFVVGYQDGGNSSYGTAIIGTLPSDFIPQIIMM
jgi:outer membrane lipoprotein SlyB